MTGGGEEELLAKRDDKEDVLASGDAEQSLLHNSTGRVASDQQVIAPPVINIEPVLDNNTEYGSHRYVLGLKNKYQV
jgi:hypothetical protein